MEKDVITGEAIIAILDVHQFMNVFDNDSDYHLAQNPDDYERLLKQHHAQCYSGKSTEGDDLTLFIRDTEFPNIDKYLAEIKMHLNGAEWEDEYLNVALQYRRILEKKLETIKPLSVKVHKEKPEKPVPPKTLWGYIKPIAVEYIKEQVERDRHNWKGHPFNYMKLWKELIVRGFILEKYSITSGRGHLKTKLTILRNTFPDAGLAKTIGVSRSGWDAPAFNDCVTGKIITFSSFEKYHIEYMDLFGSTDETRKAPYNPKESKMDQPSKKILTKRDIT